MSLPANLPDNPLLSILCITNADGAAVLENIKRMAIFAGQINAEMVVVADGAASCDRIERTWGTEAPLIDLYAAPSGTGYLEAIHDGAVDLCKGEYILRLDDDEWMNLPMQVWLAEERYLLQATPDVHWKFDRAHLWGDANHFINAGPLWPDHQTRLSVKSMARGRGVIHAGSPYGGGALAPECVIEHHVFLLRSRTARMEKVHRYDQIQPGAGTNFTAFHVPEEYWVNVDGMADVPVAPYKSIRHPKWETPFRGAAL